MAMEDYLASRPDLDAAWLFGSRATGRARPDSDVDVAVLFARSVSAPDAAFRRGRIADDLAGDTGLPVDVVDIERIAPITFGLLYPDARLLMGHDRAHRIDAVCRQYAMWQDVQPHYAMKQTVVRAFFK